MARYNILNVASFINYLAAESYAENKWLIVL